MQDPDTRDSNIKAASVKPSLLLQGETPRLIDEWQVAPVLWDSVRHEVDMRSEEGQFILTVRQLRLWTNKYHIRERVGYQEFGCVQ